jgi:hypothetical protein
MASLDPETTVPGPDTQLSAGDPSVLEPVDRVLIAKAAMRIASGSADRRSARLSTTDSTALFRGGCASIIHSPQYMLVPASAGTSMCISSIASHTLLSWSDGPLSIVY